MNISPTGEVSTQQTTTAERSVTIDHDAFLKLLIAQMRHQDPLNPADPSEQLAQLASFSSVEQMLQSNKKLDELLMSSRLDLSATLVGRTVTNPDGTTGGKVVSVQLSANGPLLNLDNGQQIGLDSGLLIGGVE